MNSMTKFVLAVFAGLLAVVVVLVLFSATDSGYVLQIPGIDSSSLPRAVSRAHINGIKVSQNGKSVFLKKTGEDDWSMTPPQGAIADRLHVRRILDLFVADIVSRTAVEAGDDDKSFGLLPDKAFVVSFLSERKGIETTVFSLEIGDVQRVDNQQPDTFVRIPGDSTVFRVEGMDLRAPFEEGLEAIRSKRFFTFRAEDIVGLDFTNPGAADAGSRLIRLVVAGTGEGTGRAATPALTGRSLQSRLWKVVEPAGIVPGKIDVIAGQIAGMTVERFADALPGGVEFGTAAPGLTVLLVDGNQVHVSVSNVVDGFRWVKKDGSSDYGRIDLIGAQSLVVTVMDVRNRLITSIAHEDITAVTRQAADGSFSIARRGNEFVTDADRGIDLERAEVETYLRQLGEMTAVSIVPPGPESTAGLDSPDVTLVIKVRNADPVQVVFSAVDSEGRRYARVGGSNDVFIINNRDTAALHTTLDQLRRHSLLSVEPSRITSITVTAASGKKATFLPPDDSAGSESKTEMAFWQVVRGDGQHEASAAATEAVGAALSISASRFIDSPRPGTVKPDLASVEFVGRDFRTVLLVSSDKNQGNYVAAAPGEKAFSRQAFLVSSAVVDSLLVFADKSK